MRDPYSILGVDRRASADELKRAYRALAKQYHPDANAGNEGISDLFAEVNAAYDLLSDPDKRAKYDRGEIDANGMTIRRPRSERKPQRQEPRTAESKAFRTEAWDQFWRRANESGINPHRKKPTAKPRPKSKPAQKAKPKQKAQEKASTAKQANSFDFGLWNSKSQDDKPRQPKNESKKPEPKKAETPKQPSPENEKSDDFLSDFFSSLKSGAKKATARPEKTERGKDVAYQLNVSFEESARGGVRRVKLPNGKRLDVKIPAGVRDGQQVRLKSQGGTGANGGEQGDALIEITIDAHRLFTRKGDDVYLTLPVTVDEAIMGAKVVVPTLDGPVTMTIPPGSNTDTTFRLKGKGVAKTSSQTEKPLGDQYVVLKVVLPPEGDGSFARAVKKWASRNPYDVRADFAS